MGKTSVFTGNERYLIVADKNYGQLLLHAKEAHPSWNFKIATPEEFLDLVSFRYTEDPIPTLLKEGFDYSRAKQWARYLRLSDGTRNEKLLKIRTMIEDKIAYDPLAAIELKRCKIAFFEMKEDRELHEICARKGWNAWDLTAEDFGFEKRFDETRDVIPVLSYQTKFDQFFSLFANIRARLLEHPEEKGSLLIHVDESSSDELPLSYSSYLFGIPLFSRVRAPLLSDSLVSKKMNAFFANKAFDEAPESCKPALRALYDLIDQYRLRELPFEAAYVDLQEILQQKMMESIPASSGITVFNNFVIDPNREVYVMDFQDGRFYKTHSDDRVLTDAELQAEGLNPSYVRTALDRRLKLNFLRYSKIAMLSRVEEHLQDKIYDSPFLEEFAKLPENAERAKQWKKATIKAEMTGGVYTSKALALQNAHQKDKAFAFKTSEGYMDFDSRFQGLESFSLPAEKLWSFTEIEKYFNCPFSYWMNRMLPDTNRNWRDAALGIFFHKVFENITAPSFSFPSAFEEAERAYREDAEKNHHELEGIDETFFLLYRKVLEKIVWHGLHFRSAMNILESYPEKKVRWEIEKSGDVYRFQGTIDKILVVGNGEKSYYFLVDYKTGATEFDVKEIPYGSSMQLPMYAYAMTRSQETEAIARNRDFLGFGIQHIDFSSAKSLVSEKAGKAPFGLGLASTNALYSKLAVSGLGVCDEAGWGALDVTAFKTDKTGGSECSFKGTFIKSKFTTDIRFEGPIAENVGPKKESWTYGDMENAVIENALWAIRGIKAGDFPIRPTSRPKGKPFNPRNANCKFCPYGDICYKKYGRDAVSCFAPVPSKEEE